MSRIVIVILKCWTRSRDVMCSLWGTDKPRDLSFNQKTGRWTLSGIVTVILIFHRQKLTDLAIIMYSVWQTKRTWASDVGSCNVLTYPVKHQCNWSQVLQPWNIPHCVPCCMLHTWSMFDFQYKVLLIQILEILWFCSVRLRAATIA
jgi:hypothetical protein